MGKMHTKAERTEKVEDVLKIGDKVRVRLRIGRR